MANASAVIHGNSGANRSRRQARNFLLLQGPIGSFFGELAERLRAGGNGVRRILFNGGDRYFWHGPGAVEFRGGLRQWPEFFAARLKQWDITDVVLFGDLRPLHRTAIPIARQREIPVHVFEEGYLRPHWITLETGGVNGYSSLPREPQWYRDAAAGLPPIRRPHAVASTFRERATDDVLYTLANLALARRYPGYRSHKPWHPLQEYKAGARRFFSRPAARRHAEATVTALTADSRPYFVFPLQLEADSQIRFHSAHRSMVPAIAEVIASFARHAPADSRLAITEHPLDSGVVDLGAATRDSAAAAGVTERIVFIQGGSSEPLLRHGRGLVTVNSTVGLLALEFGVPVKVLGRAIYDLPGLTAQVALDSFWTGAAPPDPVLLDCFRRVVAARTQINGAFYSRAGQRLAVQEAAMRLCIEPSQPVAAPAPGRPAPDLSVECLLAAK